MIIKNGNLVDLESGRVKRLDIEISGKTISRIGDNLDGDRVIDANNSYILPGLIDSHVHIGTSIKDLGRFLKSGVTSVRNMIGIERFNINRWLGGTRVFNHLTLRERIDRGELTGPNIITAGPLLEGRESAFPQFMYKRIFSKEEGRLEVKRQFKMGYDFIKVYPTLSKEAFLGIIREAKELGIKVCGHVPYSVGLKESKELGLYLNEHLHGLFYPLKPDIEPDSKEREELLSYLESSRSLICPTLIAWERLGNLDNTDFEKEVGFKELSYREKSGMRFLNKIAADFVKKRGLKFQYEYLNELRDVIKNHSNRDLILAGTDCSLPYVVPGISLIQEIINLGSCGLSNLEAIRCGTINPGKAFDFKNRVGEIKEGYLADIILLDQNPLEDLRNLFSINRTISKGVVLDP